jgi:hypothetical protein
VYGFSPTERLLLAQEGWTDLNVDQLLDHDFTPNEILKMATMGIHAAEVLEMVKEGYDPEAVKDFITTRDDVPVMDRKGDSHANYPDHEFLL